MIYFNFSAVVSVSQPEKFCMTIIIALIPKIRSKPDKVVITPIPLKYSHFVSSLLSLEYL